MKRTPLKRGTKQLKKSGFKQKLTVPLKRSILRARGVGDTSVLKEDIQRLVRLVVTIRDGGCILRNLRCGNTAYVEDEKVISDTVIQADHLVTRSNSATYADTRLIVCLCRGCHGWKKWNEKEYDILVKKIISKERVALWDRAEADRQSSKTYKADWKLEILNLKSELKKIK